MWKTYLRKKGQGKVWAAGDTELDKFGGACEDVDERLLFACLAQAQPGTNIQISSWYKY